MKLYFIRHTSAADSAPSDAQRPLTMQGEAEARTLGAALLKLGVQTNHICASPLLRAKQTASLVAQQLRFIGGIETLAELENEFPTEDLLKALPAQADSSFILVGHMPSIAAHVAALISEAESGQDLSFSKGSVACVELSKPQVRAGKLAWFKHLRDLR